MINDVRFGIIRIKGFDKGNKLGDAEHYPTLQSSQEFVRIWNKQDSYGVRHGYTVTQLGEDTVEIDLGRETALMEEPMAEGFREHGLDVEVLGPVESYLIKMGRVLGIPEEEVNAQIKRLKR